MQQKVIEQWFAHLITIWSVVPFLWSKRGKSSSIVIRNRKLCFTYRLQRRCRLQFRKSSGSVEIKSSSDMTSINWTLMTCGRTIWLPKTGTRHSMKEWSFRQNRLILSYRSREDGDFTLIKSCLIASNYDLRDKDQDSRMNKRIWKNLIWE